MEAFEVVFLFHILMKRDNRTWVSKLYVALFFFSEVFIGFYPLDQSSSTWDTLQSFKCLLKKKFFCQNVVLRFTITNQVFVWVILWGTLFPDTSTLFIFGIYTVLYVSSHFFLQHILNWWDNYFFKLIFWLRWIKNFC